MQSLILTNHAKQRIQQRGISGDILDFILEQADKVHYTTSGAHSIFVSKKRIKKLIHNKILKPRLAEKVKGVVLIENGGVVITAFHQTKSRVKH